MEIRHLKKDKGVAGLEILVSLVATLFILGILVMAFTLTGSKLADAVSTQLTGSATNETLSVVDNLTWSYLTPYTRYGVGCSIGLVTNATTGYKIESANYTTTGSTGGCGLKWVAHAKDDGGYYGLNWNVSYTYTYPEDTDAVQSINDTKVSIKSVTDWFSTFIVIGAVVVLVLLIVLVIIAIRRAGLMGGGASA